MPGYDNYGQKVPFPKLSDAPNVEAAMTAMVNGSVALTNMVFANANERAASIPDPVAGMETYLIAEGRKDFYNGAVWVQIATAPVWVDYAGVWSGLTSLGSSVPKSRYSKSGTRVDVSSALTCAGGTLGTGQILVSLPFPAANVGDSHHGWQGLGRFSSNDGTAWTTIVARVDRGSTTAAIHAVRPSDTGWVNVGTLGNPWIAGASLRVNFTYESTS